jgi:outer membrane protein assembly factor BamB
VPKPGQSSQLDGVYCTASSNCWAVGGYFPHTAGAELNQVLRWNGKHWSLVGTPNPGGTGQNDVQSIDGVRCTSANNCIAVGTDGNIKSFILKNEALRWNGRKWSLATTPNPDGTGAGASNELSAANCVSATSCWAVGSYGSTSGGTGEILNEALRWNGTKWSGAGGPLRVAAATGTGTARVNWPQYGFGPARDNFNGAEHVLSPAAVHALRQRWTSHGASGSATNAPATVVSGVVYLGTQDGLYARNATTGKLLWHNNIGLDYYSAPAVVNGIVYAGSYDLHGGDEAYLWALSATTGHMLWRLDLGNSTTVPQSPIVANGVVYDSNDTDVFAVVAATGQPMWTYLGPGTGELGDLAMSGGTLFLRTADGLDALNPSTGGVRWSAALPAAQVLSIPVVANGVVYAGSNLVLYAISASTGRQLWLHFFSGATGLSFLSIAAACGRVFVGTYNDSSQKTYLYALTQARRGRQAWRYPSGSSDTPPQPVVADDVVYANVGGTLLALRAATGHRLLDKRIIFGGAPPVIVNGLLYAAGTTNVTAYGLPRR